MLDRNKVYSGYVKVYKRDLKSSPSKKFRRVKILFEDDISFYVESLTEKDQQGYGIRYSAKKHCYLFAVVDEDKVPDICKNCVLHRAASRYTNK